MDRQKYYWLITMNLLSFMPRPHCPILSDEDMAHATGFPISVQPDLVLLPEEALGKGCDQTHFDEQSQNSLGYCMTSSPRNPSVSPTPGPSK